MRYSLQDFDLTPFTADFNANNDVDLPVSPRSRYQRQVGRGGTASSSSSSRTSSGAEGIGSTDCENEGNALSLDLPYLKEAETSSQSVSNALYDLQGVVCHSGSLNQVPFNSDCKKYKYNKICRDTISDMWRTTKSMQ